MMFLKTAVLFGLVASICASPLPQEGENDVFQGDWNIEAPEGSFTDEKRDAALEVTEYNTLVARVAFKDTKCPVYGNTFKADTIKAAVQRENAKANPEKYGNSEGGKKLFNVKKQLYKTSLDKQVRAVFSRANNGNYEYRGLIEHDKGTGNGFHKC